MWVELKTSLCVEINNILKKFKTYLLKNIMSN